MAFIPSLNSGASGLSAYSRAMSVVGSNIANVNTVGFKANQVSFEDILASDFMNTPGDGRLSNGVSIANVMTHGTEARHLRPAVSHHISTIGLWVSTNRE